MKKIFKYHLQITDTQTIELNRDYKILSVGEQYGELKLWVVVDLEKPKGTMKIEIRGTGHDIDEPDALFCDWEYINTVQCKNGLVWHIFNNKAPF